MKRVIDNCEVCQPINKLLDFMEASGYKIIEEKLADYHFKEMYFKVHGGKTGIPTFEKITKISSNKFTCECHWSTVEIASD